MLSSTIFSALSLLLAGVANAQAGGFCRNPASLTDQFQSPSLIVPMNRNNPNVAFGSSSKGTVSPTVASIFNFRVPPEYAGRKCNLVFMLPVSGYEYGGVGSIEFARLQNPATEGTTYNNKGGVKENYGRVIINPGTGTNIAQFDCPAGQVVGYYMSVPDDSTMSISWSQKSDPATGLWMTVC